MNIDDIIKEMCKNQNMSLAQLAQEMGQSRQNLYQKLKRNSISSEELRQISGILGASYEQSFVFPDGTRIKINAMG